MKKNQTTKREELIAAVQAIVDNEKYRHNYQKFTEQNHPTRAKKELKDFIIPNPDLKIGVGLFLTVILITLFLAYQYITNG